MNIYIVKIYEDIRNRCDGIDSTTNTVFTSLPEAENFLAEEYNRELKSFLDDGATMEDLEMELKEDYFHINDDNDYITGQIEEHEL